MLHRLSAQGIVSSGDALQLICAYDAQCDSAPGHQHQSNKPFQPRYSVLRLRRWTKANIALWEQGFSALCKFRSREGHCCPPPDHVEGTFRLGLWVTNQRRRKALLPLARERRLDAIGFIWDPRDHNWERGFIALLNFKRREGHCRVPQFHFEGEYRLGSWVSAQRAKSNLMSAERMARLNKIGFVWRAGLRNTTAEADYQNGS
jgi:Helicase associated domain